MYNDGGVTDNLFTGYYDAVEGAYVTPSAKQTFLIVFPTFYLSSDDNDFADNGITIESEVGDSTDITIGNAPAQVLNATMLNPDGLMESLTWGYGTAYIGVVTAETTADTYNSWPVHVLFNSHHYGITSSGTAYYDSTSQAIGGEPRAIVVKQDGTAVYYTSTGAYKYDGGFSAVTPDAFTAAKYGAYDTEPLGILLDANGCPATINNVTADTKTVTTYIPMGVFDFSNVDAYGVTFGVEAYDKMVKFDEDATAWAKALDFTTPKTISNLITALATQMGLTAVVSASAVNTALSFSENPIFAYSVTYRQILKQLAEAIGCNARISRDGTKIEFCTFTSTPVATIRPDVIIGNTRTKARYTVPQITEVVCYDTVGQNYSSGTSGVTYFISVNPFLLNLDQDTTPLGNILTLLQSGIPVYYPTNIAVACSDPRWDVGDYVTVNTTDGTPAYAVPVTHCTLAWNGMCKSNIQATGNQTRTVPSDMVNADLTSTVNGRKILEGVDAKRITVLDANLDIIFNADADTDEVQIAEFTVEADNFRYYHAEQSSEVPAEDDDYETKASKTGFTTQSTEWHDLSGTEYSIGKFSQVSQGEIEVTTDNQYPGDARAGTTIVGGGWVETDVHFSDHNRHIYAGISSNQDAPIYARDDHNNGASIDQIDISPTSIEFSQNGSVIKKIDAVGPTITSDSGSGNRSSGSTAVKITSFTLDPGTYIVSVGLAYSGNTSGRRFAELQDHSTGNAITPVHQITLPPANSKMHFGFSGPYTCAFQTTIDLMSYQNSGSTLTLDWYWSYVRLA